MICFVICWVILAVEMVPAIEEIPEPQFIYVTVSFSRLFWELVYLLFPLAAMSLWTFQFLENY